MYQPLLTRKYLGSKVMPMLAALGVALSVCMVLVVWSVMGGFLATLLGSGKQLIGDVSIRRAVDGIPHYQVLIERLEGREEVLAATGVIETPGLLNLPYVETFDVATGGTTVLRDPPRPVAVVGIDPESYDRVTGLHERLYWQPVGDGETVREDDWRRDASMAGHFANGERMSEVDPRTGEAAPAALMGIEVSGLYTRERDGSVTPQVFFLPRERVTVSVVPISGKGAVLDTVDRGFPVANEFRTGLFEADSKTVMVPVGVLQEMLQLDEREVVDPEWTGAPEFDAAAGEFVVPEPEVVGVEPARVTTVLVKAAPGFDERDVLEAATAVYGSFAAEFADAPPPRVVRINTWEEQPGLKTFIAAVKKEIALVLFLFVIISLTAVVLILAIFWSMVSEKTKDIGILRSVGASRLGVCWLFVRYGVAIGVVGSIVGAVLAGTIVTNINEIHGWLGEAFGLVIWDPSVYYFFRIPTDIDPQRFGIVVFGGVLSSAMGALIPAMRAALLDPVKALRFE